MQKAVRVFLGLYLMAMLVSPGHLTAAERNLVFGVHPFIKLSEVTKAFKPVTEYLSKELSREVQLVVGKDYDQIIDRYRKGEVDFGYMGPSIYAMESEEGVVTPLARIVVNGKGTFQGVIVVKEDSPLRGISELKGKSFAFGDPESTLSHYMPHFMLLQHGIKLKDLAKHAFVGNHENVAMKVIQGEFTAGGLKPDVAEKYYGKGLRALASSVPIPEHLFVANAKLDEASRQKIKAALLKADPEVFKLINKSITGTETAKPEDYAGVRKMMSEVDRNDPAGK